MRLFHTPLVPLAIWVFSTLVCDAAPSDFRAANARAATFEGTFKGQGGLTVAFESVVVPEARGAIVILSGYTESYRYYDDLIADLVKENYSVYIMDHRGMGRSGREVANRQIVHTKNFEDYVLDAEAFVDAVVKSPTASDTTEPLYLLAHSMGGFVGAELLAKRPDLFRAASLSAPLMMLNFGAWPDWLAHAVVTAAVKLRFGDRYAVGYHDFDPRKYVFPGNGTTHDEARFGVKLRGYIDNPDLVMGGPSNSWVQAMIEATNAAVGLGTRIKTPFVLFQAGDDRFVAALGQDRLCDEAKDFCRKVVFKTAWHEIIRETDDVRSVFLKETLALFAAH